MAFYMLLVEMLECTLSLLMGEGRMQAESIINNKRSCIGAMVGGLSPLPEKFYLFFAASIFSAWKLGVFLDLTWQAGFLEWGRGGGMHMFRGSHMIS